MSSSFVLSRDSLGAFLACSRRFELRYVERLAWPWGSEDERAEPARLQGERFHQLAHQMLVGLPVDVGETDPTLRAWLERLSRFLEGLPPGRRLAEIALAVPIGRHRLIGRFDLLLLSPGRAHIYDWKSQVRPRLEAELRTDLQSRLYLALAAEGLSALDHPVGPERIELTYWNSNAPEAPVTLSYGRSEHRRTWVELEAAVSRLEELAAGPSPWPLTEDEAACGRCAYPVCCHRPGMGGDLAEWEAERTPAGLEPPLA
jgi:hypothetical protein